MQDLILIDKPKGITSFDVIRVLRKKMSIRKMGHAGTLDPNATGLLIIGVGKGTKKLKNMIGLPKVYEAEIHLGIQTDTGDSDGTIIQKKDIPFIPEDTLNATVESLVGSSDLPVPRYSAIKRNGKPLYMYARKGIYIKPPVKTMTIFSITILGTKLREAESKHRSINPKDSTITLRLHVSSGTYIRSIAEELGIRLGTVATLKNLRRTSIGDFTIDQAVPL